MKTVAFIAWVFVTGCGLRQGRDSHGTATIHPQAAFQNAAKNPIERLPRSSPKALPMLQPEEEPLEIEVQYYGFPTEDPHFATYRLKDGRLEFEWHKGEGPRRQWKVSSAQLESLRAVIESVHREAWSGIYWTPVLDGGAVFCTIKKGDCNSQFEGSNAAPPCFAELLETMDAIAGEQVGSFWEMPPGLHFESLQAMSEIGSDEIERMLQESDGRFHPIRQRSP